MVPFAIHDDVFMPANDPYGRNGIKLDEMLGINQNLNNSNKKSKLKTQEINEKSETKSKIRFVNNLTLNQF